FLFLFVVLFCPIESTTIQEQAMIPPYARIIERAMRRHSLSVRRLIKIGRPYCFEIKHFSPDTDPFIEVVFQNHPFRFAIADLSPKDRAALGEVPTHIPL